MRKFSLIAGTAALALTATAADAAKKKNMESKWYDGQTTVDFTVQEGEIYSNQPFIPTDNETYMLELVNGGTLVLEGRAAYIMNANGSKFLANNAPHTTTAGITYQTEDGEVIYATPAAKKYTFVADVRDDDNDGMADDVNITIQ